MKKRILILTASFGEGHNSAARGVRDGSRVWRRKGLRWNCTIYLPKPMGRSTSGAKGYLALVNFAPAHGELFTDGSNRKKDFDQEFAPFSRLKDHFTALLDRFQPDVMICTFPAYPNVLRQIAGENPARIRPCKSVVVVTDSITINAAWYRCAADYFLVANEQSASVLRAVGIAPQKIKVFGFPVNPKFAEFVESNRVLPQVTPSAVFCT